MQHTFNRIAFSQEFSYHDLRTDWQVFVYRSCNTLTDLSTWRGKGSPNRSREIRVEPMRAYNIIITNRLTAASISKYDTQPT